MMTPVAPDVWSVQHAFSVNGLPISSRMTVVRLPGQRLWLHSPVPLSPALQQALAGLGQVAWLVAPSKVHHLFLAEAMATYPQAQVWAAPGLADKRPDVTGLLTLGEHPTPAEWAPALSHQLFEGIPLANETVWFHAPSRTLILTDLCQWWPGPLPWNSRLYAWLTGVRSGMAVPHTVRWLVRDRAAARKSADRLLAWPCERVVMAHQAVVDDQAHRRLMAALAVF